MSNGCVEFDYITPGSPIEQYLASVGVHDDTEFDQIENEAEVNDPSIFAFFGMGFILYRALIFVFY